MKTAEWSVEDKSCERSVVVVPNTDVDPWTVVVHFHHTPDEGERRKDKGVQPSQNVFNTNM